MTDSTTQAQILAFAVYELRQLLAGHLGSADDGDLPTRTAAHLAYALHNQALAALQGKPFDVAGAISALAAVDKMFGESFAQRLSQATAGEA